MPLEGPKHEISNNKETKKEISTDEISNKKQLETDLKTKIQTMEKAENNFITKYENGNYKTSEEKLNIDELDFKEITSDKNNPEKNIYSVNTEKNYSNFPELVINTNGELIRYYSEIFNNKDFNQAIKNAGIKEIKNGKNYEYYIGDKKISLENAYGKINKEIFKIKSLNSETVSNLKKALKSMGLGIETGNLETIIKNQ